MEYFLKKIWLSAILSILVLITGVTSTYAWYAMTRTNNVEDFNFDIKGGNSLAISTNGIDFQDSLSSLDVKKAILQKRGIDASGLSDDKVNSLLNIVLDPVTPKDYTSLDKGFQYVDNKDASDYKYISFDIYLASNNDNKEEATSVRFSTINPVKASDKYVSFDGENVNDESSLGKISDGVKMNVANAMRLALTTYDVCLYSDILNSSNNPHTTIYSIGGNAPNVKNNVYNFGGINTEYNLAVDLYNQRSENQISIPQNERNDLDYDTTEIISSNDGLYSGMMKKMTVYLWLEGWDADCITELQGEAFTFELGMSSSI